MPNLLEVVRDIESFGAEGITIHPRPDERHIRYQDARDLKGIVRTELNIEGNPIPKFIDLVLEVRPDQVTLVPDAPDAITSNAGWDTRKHVKFLREVIDRFRDAGIRTSIFVDPDPDMVRAIVAAVKAEVDIPVIPKLTPNTPSIADIAKAAEEGERARLVLADARRFLHDLIEPHAPTFGQCAAYPRRERPRH